MPTSRISERRFRELVGEALDGLPDEWAEALDNIAVVVEEEPALADLDALGMDPAAGDELLGLYHGTRYTSDRRASTGCPIAW